MNKRTSTKRVILFVAGMLISIAPVSIATLSYFPLWREAGNGSALSGLALLLVLLAGKPLYNYFKKFFSSPSAWVMWLFIFAVFFAFSRIADEVTVISFVGFISNVIGAVLFKLSGLSREKEVTGDEQKL